VIWDPTQPWPGTPGGATSPHWGGYVRLYVRAGIEAGTPFHIGTHANDHLDAGNVMSAAASRVPVGRLWADVTCDVTEVAVVAGATGTPGITTQTEAGTCQITLADPNGIYDPTNPESPYRYQGRSRLVPGVPVEVFAEVVNPAVIPPPDPDALTWGTDELAWGTDELTWGPPAIGEPVPVVSTHYLFTGTADSWEEDWTPHPSERRATLLATDPTKVWVRYDRPEAAPAGAGDTTAERVQRLVDYYDWPGPIEPAATSTVTLQATTFAASGWELLGRTLDDELGMVHFTPTGALRWTDRAAWFNAGPPVVTLGCQAIATGLWDVIVDAAPSNLDTMMRNVVRAARTGGTVQTAQSVPSIDAYGPYEYQRTDLGVLNDGEAGQWATDMVTVSAFPRVWLSDVTLVPGIADSSFNLWPVVLDVEYVTDAVRIVWAPPDRPTAVVNTAARVVGSEHKITRGRWETVWQLAVAGVTEEGVTFTMGPHAQDHLDAGNVLALAA
jgi:hypothetical protein